MEVLSFTAAEKKMFRSHESEPTMPQLKQRGFSYANINNLTISRGGAHNKSGIDLWT